MKKIIVSLTILAGSFANSFSLIASESVYKIDENNYSTISEEKVDKQSRESCRLLKTVPTSGWSYGHSAIYGQHPDQGGIKDRVSSYSYGLRSGTWSVSTSLGPVSISRTIVGGTSGTVPADVNRGSRLIVREIFKSRTVRREYQCTKINGRENVTTERAYYVTY